MERETLPAQETQATGDETDFGELTAEGAKLATGESFETRVENTLWRGNGQKPLVTRMEVVETEVHNVKEMLEQMNRNLNKIALLVLGVFLTIVGDLIVRGVGR